MSGTVTVVVADSEESGSRFEVVCSEDPESPDSDSEVCSPNLCVAQENKLHTVDASEVS